MDQNVGDASTEYLGASDYCNFRRDVVIISNFNKTKYLTYILSRSSILTTQENLLMIVYELYYTIVT